MQPLIYGFGGKNSSIKLFFYQELKYILYVFRTNIEAQFHFILLFMLEMEMIFKSGLIKHSQFLNLQEPV